MSIHHRYNRWQWWEPEEALKQELTALNTPPPRSLLFKQHAFIMKSHEVWTERGKESCFYKKNPRRRWTSVTNRGEQALWSLNTAQLHRQPGQTPPNPSANRSNTESVCWADAICCWNCRMLRAHVQGSMMLLVCRTYHGLPSKHHLGFPYVRSSPLWVVLSLWEELDLTTAYCGRGNRLTVHSLLNCR